MAHVEYICTLQILRGCRKYNKDLGFRVWRFFLDTSEYGSYL